MADPRTRGRPVGMECVTFLTGQVLDWNERWQVGMFQVGRVGLDYPVDPADCLQGAVAEQPAQLRLGAGQVMRAIRFPVPRNNPHFPASC